MARSAIAPAKAEEEIPGHMRKYNLNLELLRAALRDAEVGLGAILKDFKATSGVPGLKGIFLKRLECLLLDCEAHSAYS